MTVIPPTPPQKKTNGLALASLITSIVGFCIPVIGGLAAIVLGVLGVRQSKESGGKGMAIAGIVIGVISLVVPLLFAGSIVGLVLGTTSGARDSAREWMIAASSGNIGKVESHSTTDFPREDIEAMSDALKPLGEFKDMTSSSVNRTGNQVTLDGTATFANGKRSYHIVVIDLGGGDWRVQQIRME